MIIFSFNLRL